MRFGTRGGGGITICIWVFKVILGSFGSLASKWPTFEMKFGSQGGSYMDMGYQFVSQGLGVVVIWIWDTFEILVVNVILGLFSELVSK